MKKVIPTELYGSYYIPHQSVLRPESTNTVLRVGFNASSKATLSNSSLNDILSVDPKIQSDLLDILLRFRIHNIAFCVDITKMYRHVWMHEDDRNLQRIMWRESVNLPIRH